MTGADGAACGPLLPCWVLAACSARVELLSEVSEAQANDVIAELAGRGITALKVPGKGGVVSVEVPEERIANAIEIIRAAGLPREPFTRMGDVFKKDGLISSPTEERARMLFALSQELSATISKIDGVIFAQVHVVLPEHAGFGERGSPSSAAVFIKYEDTVSLDETVPSIRRLVANSIPGLTYDKVSVELVPSEAHSHATDPSEALDSVWGIKVAGGSAAQLRFIIAGLALAVLAVCVALGFVLIRLRGAGAARA
ncbi:MAG: type III secretion inner membrane ring lipoprotein SctJ [Gammaproteobacteria bacterium]